MGSLTVNDLCTTKHPGKENINTDVGEEILFQLSVTTHCKESLQSFYGTKGGQRYFYKYS